MAHTSTNIDLVEQEARKILDKIRSNTGSKDFDKILTSLLILRDFKQSNKDYLKSHRKLQREINSFCDRLEFSVKREHERRDKIEEKGSEYTKLTEQLSKCDEATLLHEEILESAEAQAFVYSTIRGKRTLEQRILSEYFDNVTDALNLPRGSFHTLSELNQKVDEYKNRMSNIAFEINKLNGRIDEQIIDEDKALVDKYSELNNLRNKLKTVNPNLYEQIYNGIHIDSKQILDDEIRSANATTKPKLEQIKKGREIFENHGDILKYIEDDIYDLDSNIIPEKLNEKLTELQAKIAASQPLTPDETALAPYIADLSSYLAADKEIRKNPALYKKINQVSTPPQGKAAVETRISELESLSNRRKLSRNESQELETLQLIVEKDNYSHLKRGDLSHLYARYNVESTKPISELKAAIDNFSCEQEIQAPSNPDVISIDSIRNAIDSPKVTKDNPTREVANAMAPEEGTNHAKDLDSFTKHLQQSHGYTPMVGRNSVVYAKPVYEGRFSNKISKMVFVEESLDSIGRRPLKAYKEALKEANKKCKALGLPTLKISELSQKFEELLENKNYDEALKRILTVKCSNSRTQLSAISTTHTSNTPTKFLNDKDFEEYYDAPKSIGKDTLLYRGTLTFNRDTPAVKKTPTSNFVKALPSTPSKGSKLVKTRKDIIKQDDIDI